MRTILNLAQRLTIESCCVCGIAFAMPEEYREKRLQDHQNFYCPNGHSQHFTGESDADRAKKLEKELAAERKQRQQVERSRDQWKDYADNVVEERDQAKKDLRTTRTQLTKTKKRLANGVCPCCNRHFTNLERHMHAKHPEYAPAEAE